MKNKIKIKYNLILGVFIGFLLAQLVMAEGYALLVAKEQNAGTLGLALPQVEIRSFKVLAMLVFIGTIGVFCTRRFRKINLNRLSIYLILVVVTSLTLSVSGILGVIGIIFKLNQRFYELILSDYFVSINFFFITWFIGICMFLGIFIFFVNRKVKYIKFITNEVNAIKEKGFGIVIEVRGEDELAQLCKSINNMSIELGKKIENEKKIEYAKNELITNISHDLKTPLTSVIGYLELLNREDTREEFEEEYLKIAYKKSLRLKELVNELFEYTNLTSHNIKIEQINFNISNLINQVVGESILDFVEKDIEVEIDNPYKELYYFIDPKLFLRLIENLVKNAEKYSDSNSKFKVIVKKDINNIEISFINKCKNIDKEQLKKIFEKFYRVDKSRNSDCEGSGLGLSIAKRIVQLHNGDLTVEKIEEEVIFKIILPS